MADESLKDRIEAAILDGRRQWDIRSLEESYAQLEQAAPEERHRIKRSRELQFFFLTKYTAIVGFYEFVEQECSKAVTYERLRRMVIDTIARSIIGEHGADLRSFDEDLRHWAEAVREGVSSGRDGTEPYTRRRAQVLLREAVPGEFITVGDDAAPDLPDSRLRPVRSVHSAGPLPPSAQSDVAQWALNLEETAMAASGNWHIYKEVGASLRFLSPTYLGSLVEFREILRPVLETAGGEMREERARRLVLRELLLRGFTPSLVALHHDVASQVALRWWARRKEPKQRGLIHDAFPFHLDSERVAKSLKLLRHLGVSATSTFGVLQLPALMLSTIRQPQDAIIVWRHFAEWGEIPSFQRGIAADNAAVLLARHGHWKLAFPLFNQAIAAYVEAKDQYREAVVLKSRGEARLRAGALNGADDMTKAERIGGSLGPALRFAVNYNLAMAAMRLGDKATLRRYLKACLIDHDDADPEKVNEVCEMLLDPRNR